MTGGRQPKYGTSLVGFLLTNNRRPRPDAMTAPEANSPWIGLRQSFGAWSPSGRYSFLSSIGIAGSALRDGSTIFSKSTSRGECRSASSVSMPEPSPAADSSEDQRSSRLPPPPFSTQLTLKGRSKPIRRRRRNWCDCLGISSASSACRNAISSKGDPGASDRLLLAFAGRHAGQTPLPNVAQNCRCRLALRLPKGIRNYACVLFWPERQVLAEMSRPGELGRLSLPIGTRTPLPRRTKPSSRFAVVTPKALLIP